jgi:hypothetical protein
MKKLLFIILISNVLSSCSTNRHYYQLTDGKWVSEKKFTKIIKRAFNNAIKMSSDEDLKLISGFEIDTVGVNN